MTRLLLLLSLALLTACSAGPKARIWPPQASLQELSLDAGSAEASVVLRLQNFSTVATRFDRVDLALTLDGLDAGRLVATPGISATPSSAETLRLSFTPPAAVRQRIVDALAASRPLRYGLTGRIDTGEPKGRHTIESSSSLHPVPGLDGVLR